MPYVFLMGFPFASRSGDGEAAEGPSSTTRSKLSGILGDCGAVVHRNAAVITKHSAANTTQSRCHPLSWRRITAAIVASSTVSETSSGVPRRLQHRGLLGCRLVHDVGLDALHASL